MVFVGKKILLYLKVSTMSELLAYIENMRQLMQDMASEKGISHPDVLRISQKLDVVLNKYYDLTSYCQ